MNPLYYSLLFVYRRNRKNYIVNLPGGQMLNRYA